MSSSKSSVVIGLEQGGSLSAIGCSVATTWSRPPPHAQTGCLTSSSGGTADHQARSDFGAVGGSDLSIMTSGPCVSLARISSVPERPAQPPCLAVRGDASLVRTLISKYRNVINDLVPRSTVQRRPGHLSSDPAEAFKQHRRHAASTPFPHSHCYPGI
jgi:hypothetical protein